MDEVTVVIRSPVSSVLDIRLECELDWRIYRIKQKISELFPGNPSVQSQKLVYAGKLLEDSAMLRDVLRMEDECTVYTIHLVCRVPASRKHEEEAAATEPQPDSRQSGQQPEMSGPVGPSDQVLDWMQFFNSSHNVNSSQFSEENLQQMAWMQQLYGQYINQYMLYIQSSGAFVQSGLGVDSVQAGVQVQAGQGGGGEGQGGGGGGGLPPVLNAGGGGGADLQQDEEEGGARNRDILDWFYISSRVLVLMSIVYFYSSLARFLLVGSLFLFLYALQMGLLQGQQREQGNNIQQEVDNIREEGLGPREEVGGGGQREPEPEPEPEPDLLTVMATFVLTFFSSLIPDHNQAVV